MSIRTIAYQLIKPFTFIVKNSINGSRLDLNDINQDVQSSCITERKYSNVNYDLDIIIPVYNVEKYLKKCLDSVCNQLTSYKYRVIIVDDGSTDNSLNICREYQHKDNILILNQNNLGVSAARNNGLNHVEAEYVMFVDSDDCLCDNAIQIMLDEASKTNDYDIIEGNYCVIEQNDQVKCKTNDSDVKNTMELYGYPWAKIYKAKIFEKIQFPEGYWYEDTVNHMIIYPNCKKAKRISDIVYNYRINEKGASASSRGNDKSIDALWVVKQLYKDRQSLGIRDDKYFKSYIFNQARLCYKRTRNLSEDIKKAIFLEQCDFYLSLMNNIDFLGNGIRPLDNDLIMAFQTKNYNLYKLNCTLF